MKLERQNVRIKITQFASIILKLWTNVLYANQAFSKNTHFPKKSLLDVNFFDVYLPKKPNLFFCRLIGWCVLVTKEQPHIYKNKNDKNKTTQNFHDVQRLLLPCSALQFCLIRFNPVDEDWPCDYGSIWWSNNLWCSSRVLAAATRSEHCFFYRICEGTLLPLGCLNDQNGENRISLRGRDRLRNDPQLFPGFLNCCSWMLPERLRNKSELVGSEEIGQVSTRHPRCDTLSYWFFLRIS